jgi:hypothetical protein
MKMMKVCKECGSSDLEQDATVDMYGEVVKILQYTFCNGCQDECNVISVRVEETA